MVCYKDKMYKYVQKHLRRYKCKYKMLSALLCKTFSSSFKLKVVDMKKKNKKNKEASIGVGFLELKFTNMYMKQRKERRDILVT